MKDRRYLDKLAEFFKQHPNELIDGLRIAKVGGAYAWRTRLSECRTELGMDIKNHQRREGRKIISEYVYTPPASAPAGWPVDGLTFVEDAR